MTTWPNLYFQDGMTPIMEKLILFHDHIMMILIMIITTISYLMIMLMVNKLTNRNVLEGQNLEMAWTLIPTMILFFIATPSLKLLYLMDEINKPMMTNKTIGHQWYWSYEYTDFKNHSFDSFMINQMEMNNLRLLDVDNRLTLPTKTFIRMIVTSNDVIHSWTLPSSGIKVDGTPGRLNQASLFLNKPGLAFGQCSEICGMNHSFMPIVIESIPMNKFIKWMMK
nr:cytochrome c oxidase subunit II [Nanhuaphasma hamicercum]